MKFLLFTPILQLVVLAMVAISSAQYLPSYPNPFGKSTPADYDYQLRNWSGICNRYIDSDTIATQFYSCYDQVPNQKAGFVDCQTQVFQTQLNTKASFYNYCQGLNKDLAKSYLTCLKGKFSTSDYNTAYVTVGKCQEALFGYDPSLDL